MGAGARGFSRKERERHGPLTAWDPDFIERSPLLDPLREPARGLREHGAWPRREALQGLFDAQGISNAAGARVRLVEARQGPYEEHIHQHAEMPFRERGWHDLFNALAWLAYPAAKAALNAAHYEAMHAGGTGPRGRSRDALTLFDESGAIVMSADATLLDDLRAFRWKRLFVERRGEVCEAMRFHVIGHALFEKALRPYVGLTAHAVLFHVSPEAIAQPLPQRVATADGLGAGAVRALKAPGELSPLPILGVPGWCPDNENPAFYDDTSYFRPGRKN